MRVLNWTVEEFEEMFNPENCEMFILELNDESEYELATAITKAFNK